MKIIILIISLLFTGCKYGGAAPMAVSSNMQRGATVSWTANTESDLAGYNIYYGGAPGEHNTRINVPSKTATSQYVSLDPGLYYFAMTAYDQSGNESEKSAEVRYEQGAPVLEKPEVSWRDVPVDTNFLLVSDTVPPLHVVISWERAASERVDSLQIDINDENWTVVKSLYFSRDANDNWVSTDDQITLSTDHVYKISARIRKDTDGWSEWADNTKRFIYTRPVSTSQKESAEIKIRVSIN